MLSAKNIAIAIVVFGIAAACVDVNEADSSNISTDILSGSPSGEKESENKKIRGPNSGMESVHLSANAENNIITCNPGCALSNDSLGKPIIPDWCEAWAPFSPTCVRFEDKTYCVGLWEGAGVSVNEITREGTVFHLDQGNALAQQRRTTEPVRFSCIRINSNKFVAGSGGYDLTTDLPSAPPSVSCSPGCIFDAKNASREFSEKPSWCLRARNAGCSSNTAVACNEPKPLNMCYRISP